MKILKIQFKNINNLKGENTISFADEPLNSAGIFAITGPTGSGKSTILDVITLSLFNKIPRFKSAISKTSIEGLGSVVTHHMDDAFASITYEIRQNTYTSTWSVKKTRNGNFKDYEMFIYDSGGTPLDLKKSEVPARNENIIGLKYDQFVKSIILSQGQFSKFLKADKHERGQLLENLTGSTIYRKISIAAYEKYKLVKDEVALEKDRLQNIVTLTDEERSLLKTQITAHEATKQTLDIVLEKLNIEKQIKLEIEKTSRTLNAKKIEEEILDKEKVEFGDKLKLLNTYEQLDAVKVDLMKFDEAKKKFQRLTSEISSNELLIKEGELSRDGIMEEMAKLIQKQITVENFRAEMSAFEKEVNALVQEIRFIGKNGKETRHKINSKAENYKIELDPKAGPEATIPKLNRELEVCNQKIINAGLETGTDLETMNVKSKAVKSELDQLMDLRHSFEHLSVAIKRIDKANEDLSVFSENITKYEPLVLSSQELVKTTKENIALLKKQEHDALLIAKLSDHRKELVDGEPCPLCGALHHPFAESEYASNSEIGQSIAKAEIKLEQFERDYEENNRLLTSNLASQNMLKKQIEQFNEEKAKVSSDHKSKLLAYSGSHIVTEDKLGESIKLVEEQSVKLTEAISAKQLHSIYEDLIQDFGELDAILKEYQDLNARLKHRYTGNDVSYDCNTLQDKFVQLSERITNLKTLIVDKQKESAEIKTYMDGSKPILEGDVKKIGFKTIDEAIAFMISDIELKQLQQKKEEFKKRGAGLQAEIKSLIANLKDQQSKDQFPEKNLEVINQDIFAKTREKETLIKTIGENTAIIQKDDAERERIKSKETELQKLQEKFDKWSLLNKLIGEKTGNKFANFAQGLTLQNLLVYANKRLQKLSDRYLLDKPIKDGALTVIDQYQGNIQRSVTTLSGGESFLISLALALSLSDMASKNVNLESLFIDEGFGTLDQESLDVAMNTLEKLQTESQKTVGVISHVEALKERIHVQIKLSKNAQGYGTLKIEG